LKSFYFIELLLCPFDQTDVRVLGRGRESDSNYPRDYRWDLVVCGNLLVVPNWSQPWYVYVCWALICGGIIYIQLWLPRRRAFLKKDVELYKAAEDSFINAPHYPSDHLEKSAAFFTDHTGFRARTINDQRTSVPTEKKFTVLLIEDNQELRAFGSELLSGTYHVLEASRGIDGLKIAFENTPDLILCEVALPEQNGVQICEQLKVDMRTSHIPIILLTAESALPDVIQALQAGADDYLVQPVDVNILLLKIQNLIQSRIAVRRFNGKSISSGADELASTGANDEFIEKLRGLVIENISQPDFGVNEMAFQIGMSVSVLYRKVRLLTGMTVNDFMKKIKMQKALELLESGMYQVSEVALMVGYESVRYFSNEFKKFYGKNPSKFRNQ